MSRIATLLRQLDDVKRESRQCQNNLDFLDRGRQTLKFNLRVLEASYDQCRHRHFSGDRAYTQRYNDLNEELQTMYRLYDLECERVDHAEDLLEETLRKRLQLAWAIDRAREQAIYAEASRAPPSPADSQRFHYSSRTGQYHPDLPRYQTEERRPRGHESERHAGSHYQSDYPFPPRGFRTEERRPREHGTHEHNTGEPRRPGSHRSDHHGLSHAYETREHRPATSRFEAHSSTNNNPSTSKPRRHHHHHGPSSSRAPPAAEYETRECGPDEDSHYASASREQQRQQAGRDDRRREGHQRQREHSERLRRPQTPPPPPAPAIPARAVREWRAFVETCFADYARMPGFPAPPAYASCPKPQCGETEGRACACAIREAFVQARADGLITAGLGKERLRWHPDRFAKVADGEKREAYVKAATEVFVVLDGMFKAERV